MAEIDHSADERIEFAKEAEESDLGDSTHGRWRVLIVDDDHDVHLTTTFAAQDMKFHGRGIEFLHAYSAEAAKDILKVERDLALILLDVVMETQSAGLDLVEFIRQVAVLKNTRIVLRTGQPGYAPELETILQYDINDYKTKSELTQIKLLTMFSTAFRSYQQMCAIDANRQGLSLIVKASGSFLQMHGIRDFAEGVITQLAALLGVHPEGVVCAQAERNSSGYSVLAAAGQFANLINQPLEFLANSRIRSGLVRALENCHSDVKNGEIVLYFGQKSGLDMAAYIDTGSVPNDVDTELLNVFCANLSACLTNLSSIEQLRTQAFYDELLKLPNRNRFIVEIDARQADETTDWTVAIVDIDDFSAVNDLMGHQYGDQLLQAMAARLMGTVSESVVVARVSGNAFGILGSSNQITPQLVRDAMEQPLVVGGNPHNVTATSGFVSFEGAKLPGADWLKNATIALKQAKRQARGQHIFYTSSIGQEARSRAQLLTDLHVAFDLDHLFMVYQPQIDLASQELIGLEALMRWRGTDGQMVPPDRFIPVAEQSGLVVALGEWALNVSCAMMRELLDLGIGPERMAVNVSVEQFKSADFVDRVARALKAAGLAGRQLELEITESVAMLGSQSVESVLHRLREMDITIAIDDFGTGYSSLSYLERLPLDRLKIDKAFVRQLGEPGAPRIAEMIIELGETLGARVLAEGIEDQASWNALQSLGCHEGQGFFIGKPMEKSDLLDWIATYRARSAKPV